ncbi:MAG: cytochrome c [Sphingobacteriaceae bacterium]|nr:cytochrome c [Sphingobacteriaceae bacterium]
MVKGIAHTHYLVVVLFLLIYVIKTVLLLSNKSELLTSFSKKIKVPEMIISTLFLATGIYLMTQLATIHYLMWIKIAMILLSIPLAVIGFKKSNKILASVSLLLLTASFGLAEVAAKKKMKADNEGISSSDGKALYVNNCSMCHGDNGKLGVMGAKDISLSTMNEQQIVNVILKGEKSMNPVPVSIEQANAIAAYVETEIKGH